LGQAQSQAAEEKARLEREDQSSRERIRDLEERSARLDSQLAERERDNRHLAAELESRIKQNENLVAAQNSLQAGLSEIESQRDTLARRLTEIEGRQEMLNQEVKSLEGQLDASRSRLLGLERELSETQGKRASLERELASARDHAASLESQVRENPGSAVALADYETLQTRIITLENERQISSQRENVQADTITRLEGLLREVRGKVSESDAARPQIDSALRAKSEAEAGLKRAEERISLLESELARALARTDQPQVQAPHVSPSPPAPAMEEGPLADFIPDQTFHDLDALQGGEEREREIEERFAGLEERAFFAGEDAAASIDSLALREDERLFRALEGQPLDEEGGELLTAAEVLGEPPATPPAEEPPSVGDLSVIAEQGSREEVADIPTQTPEEAPVSQDPEPLGGREILETAARIDPREVLARALENEPPESLPEDLAPARFTPEPAPKDEVRTETRHPATAFPYPEITGVRLDLFRGSRVLLVGGDERFLSDYEHLFHLAGADLTYFPSIIQLERHGLKRVVKECDHVVVFGRAVTEPGILRMRLASDEFSKPLTEHHSSGLVSLYHRLQKASVEVQ
jgi:hypothetical protein